MGTYELELNRVSDRTVEYLVNYIGEDNIITGSDYSQFAPAAEPHHIDVMRAHREGGSFARS